MKKVLLGTIISLAATVSVAGLSYKFFHKPDSDSIVDIAEDDPLYRNEVIAKPAKGNPDEYDPIENLFIAQGVFLEQKYKSTITTGSCKATIYGINQNQTVKNRKYINETECFSEAISNSSIVHVANQRYVTSNDYLVRNGKSGTITEDGASYDEIKAITKQSYLNQFGYLPFGFSNYVLNTNSIKNAEVISSDGDYVYKYNLNVEIATAKLARETKTMAGSSSLPTFVNSSIIVTMDKDWVVSKLESIESYDIDIIANVRCNSNLISEYFYQDTPYEIKEREEFKKYFGSIPSDEEEVIKTDKDYLLEAASSLLSEEDGFNINGQVKINDRDVNINAFINLAKMAIKVNLDDKLTIYFENNELYVNFGKIFASVSLEEINELTSNYLGIDLNEFDMSSLLENEMIASALDNMVSKREDNSLTISLNMFPVCVDIDLLIDEKDKASFNNIQFGLTYKDINIDGKISFFGKPYKYLPIPDNVEKLSNINGNIESIQEFFSRKDFNFEYNLDINDILIAGEAYLNLDEGISFETDLNLTYQNSQFIINIKYIEGYFYVNYEDNIRLKLSLDEIKLLINQIETIFGITIFNQENMFTEIDIANIDFATILESITCNSDGLSGKVNLSQFGLNEIVDLKYAQGQEVSLNIPSYGYIKMTKAVHRDVITDNTSSLTYQDIAQYLDFFGDLYINKSLTLNVDFGFSFNDIQIDIVGEIVINITDSEILKDSVELVFNGDIIINNETYINLDGVYKDSVISLSVLGKKIVLTYDEIKELVYQASDLFSLPHNQISDVFSLLEGSIKDLDLAALDNPLNMIKLFEIVSSEIKINVEGNNISLSLDENNNLNVSFSDGNKIEIKVNEQQADIQPISEHSDLSKDDISRILNMTKDIIINKDARDFIINLDLNYQNIALNGDIYLCLEDIDEQKVVIDGEVIITYNDELIPVKISYVDQYFYLSYRDNFGVKLTYQELIDLINDTLIKFDQEPIQLDNNIDFSTLTIETLLGDITSTEETVNLIINLDSIGLKNVNLQYHNDGFISVEYDSLLKANLCVNEHREYHLNDNIVYLEKGDLVQYIDQVAIYYQNRSAHINDIDIAFNVDNLSISLRGQAVLTYDDYLKIEGQFELIIGNIYISFDLTVIDTKIYIGLGNVNFEIDYNEINLILVDLENAFNLDLSKIKNSLDFTNVDLSSLSIKSIIDNLYINQENIRYLINNDGDNMALSFTKEGNFNVLGDSFGKISLCAIEGVEITSPNYESVVNYSQIAELIRIAKDGYEYRNYDSFTFSFKGNADDARYEGDLIIHLLKEENGNATIDQFQIDVNVEEISLGRTHQVKMIYDNGTAYINYNDKTKAYIDKMSALQLLSDINNLTIKNDFLANLLKDFTVSKEIDIFSYYDKGDSEYFVVNDIIKSLSIVNRQINLKLFINGENYYIILGSDENHLLNGNLSCASFNVNIINQSLTGEITPPSTEGYMNFSSLDELVTAVINTINIKEYHVGLTDFEAKISTFKVKAQVQIDAIVDENNKPLAYVKLLVPYILGVTNKYTESEIVFDGDLLYVHRYSYSLSIFTNKKNNEKHEYLTWTLDEFSADAMNKIYYLANFTSSISSIIDKALSDANDGNNLYMDFDDIIWDYSYNESDVSYYLLLNGVELCQNSNVQDISITLYENVQNHALYKANLVMDLVNNVIKLSILMELLDNDQVDKSIFTHAAEIITKCN